MRPKYLQAVLVNFQSNALSFSSKQAGMPSDPKRIGWLSNPCFLFYRKSGFSTFSFILCTSRTRRRPPTTSVSSKSNLSNWTKQSGQQCWKHGRLDVSGQCLNKVPLVTASVKNLKMFLLTRLLSGIFIKSLNIIGNWKFNYLEPVFVRRLTICRFI